MRPAGIFTGGIVALILLAVVCIPRHLSSPRPAMTHASFHASVEQGSLVFRGSLPNERSKATILEQAHVFAAKTRMRVIDQFTVDTQVKAAVWVDTVPQLLPIFGLMVERGSIIIDGRSLVVTGQVRGSREKAEILQAVAPAIRAGLRIEDRVGGHADNILFFHRRSPVGTSLLLNQILAKSSIDLSQKCRDFDQRTGGAGSNHRAFTKSSRYAD